LDGFLAVPLLSEDDPSTTTPEGRWFFQISPGYLQAMGINLLQGRDFNALDTHDNSKVVLVSKTLASILWPGRDPIGKHVKISSQPEWATVVGVVSDVRTYKVAGADMSTIMNSIHGTVYFPEAQLPANAGMSLVVRANTDFASLTRTLRDTVAALAPNVPVSDMRTMDEVVFNSVAAPRSTMWLFAFFAFVALLLGIVGVYSVMSYFVAQRTREIAIRMAVGATKWQVMKMVLGQGLNLTVLGIVFGLAGAALFARMLAGLLYGVGPIDPIIFSFVSVTVVAASMLATYIPSRQATGTHPAVALNSSE
jgi:putative ABC transport system permease protein